jgi:8-oxo-dGTP pyrophosphatase MutT (NUDIX family)
VLMRAVSRGSGGPGGFEVFVQRRVPTMVFAAGMNVFPGGAREAEDQHLGATAVRELAEETGVELPVSALVPWARWVTPEGEPRRYDTYFFVAALPAGAEPVVRGTEMDTIAWLSPAQALAAYDRGDLPMMPPTVITLRELAAFSDLGSVLAGASGRTLDPVRPRILDDEEGIRLELPGGEVFE